MIPTQRIPQDQWLAYFNDMSRRYRGWGVTIEVARLDLGNQPAAVGLPLQGFSFEPRGSAAGDILIEAGDDPGEFFIHQVDGPEAVRVTETQIGVETALQIESADGTKTLVLLRRLTALPPAMA
jgi:hypothetical protein